MRIRWTQPAILDLTGVCDYVGEHVVIYRIREQVVEIARILHDAQSWP
jgi:hypothetical protein